MFLGKDLGRALHWVSGKARNCLIISAIVYLGQNSSGERLICIMTVQVLETVGITNIKHLITQERQQSLHLFNFIVHQKISFGHILESRC